MKNRQSNIVLIKDKEWSFIDGKPCRVTDFAAIGAFVDASGVVHTDSSTIPYAVIIIECVKFGKNVTGYITHKIDFKNLWLVFKDRPHNDNEEVIIFWTKKYYKRAFRLFYGFMPRLRVMVCPKGAYELMADIDPEPKLTGEARWLAMKPIVDLKPDVME